MAIRMPVKKVDNEDHSFFGQIAKPVGLAGLLAGVAAPFTAGGSLAALSGAAAAGTTASTLGAISAGTGAASAIHGMNQKPPEEPKQAPALPAQDSGAISRKFAQVNNDPTHTVLEAGRALSRMPEDLQNEYKPQLLSTYAALRRGRV